MPSCNIYHLTWVSLTLDVGYLFTASKEMLKILQARILERVALPSSRGFALQEGSLTSVPPGKPKNTGVGKLSFLQGIFPTQQLEWGLLHCRRILYQLSYQGSLKKPKRYYKNSLHVR